MNRQRFRSIIAAGALAVGATLTAAPIAHAEKLSEKTIKSE